MPRSAPSAAVRGVRITAAVRAARRSCQNAATAQKSSPVWGSSGESRVMALTSVPPRRSGEMSSGASTERSIEWLGTQARSPPLGVIDKYYVDNVK